MARTSRQAPDPGFKSVGKRAKIDLDSSYQSKLPKAEAYKPPYENGNLRRSDISILVKSDETPGSPNAPPKATKAWLNDEIILGYMNIVCFHANHEAGVAGWTKGGRPLRYVPMNSFFYETITRKSTTPEQIKRILGRKNLDGAKILDPEHIFIPINVNKTHWALAVISPELKMLSYLDSLDASKKSIQERLTPIMQVLRQTAGSTFKEKEWVIYNGNTPKQPNGYDCGVYTLMFVTCIAFGINWNSINLGDAAAKRLCIACELVNGGFTDPITPGFVNVMTLSERAERSRATGDLTVQLPKSAFTLYERTDYDRTRDKGTPFGTLFPTGSGPSNAGPSKQGSSEKAGKVQVIDLNDPEDEETKKPKRSAKKDDTKNKSTSSSTGLKPKRKRASNARRLNTGPPKQGSSAKVGKVQVIDLNDPEDEETKKPKRSAKKDDTKGKGASGTKGKTTKLNPEKPDEKSKQVKPGATPPATSSKAQAPASKQSKSPKREPYKVQKFDETQIATKDACLQFCRANKELCAGFSKHQKSSVSAFGRWIKKKFDTSELEKKAQMDLLAEEEQKQEIKKRKRDDGDEDGQPAKKAKS
ncbi:hypothetical protein BP5796_05093 [Coleophoma crateriformis]|uniref:Ubiquitin-like protease family profile domain-containing protein n=1 Tax=Coleophoma crateriformis TaxID=565419 RepID=A0A3D8S287_9HELO|nr:hypothetical protein BP5796_05093 [Coleophoma crateriformis]